MKLDFEDYGIVGAFVVAARAGAFVMTKRATKASIDYLSRRMDLAHNYNQWSHGAIRAMLMHLGIPYPPAPVIEVKDIPPRSTPNFANTMEEISKTGLEGKG